MKFEIVDKIYFVESMITISIMGIVIFLSLFIGKEWYKSVIEIFKRGKKK